MDPQASTSPDRANPSESRGAPGRVVAVHAQNRRGLALAASFTAAAVLSTTVRSRTGWWLPLHLFAIGGLLGAISATAPMLAVTWSASPAPRLIVARLQRWSLATGAIAVVAGRQTGTDWLFVAGGVLVVVAIVALVPILMRVRRHAVTDRFAPAIEAYTVAVAAGAVGLSLGIVLGTGRAGALAAEARSAHLLLNLFGLVGLVIAGTLPYFAATQVRRKMSRRATPVAMRGTFLGLGVATVVAALGRALDRPGVVAAGLVVYALGIVAVAAMLPMYGRAQLVWAGPRAVQLLSGIAWWVAMTVALAWQAVGDGDERAILVALVIGAYAQILVASIAYLGPVLRGGGHRHLTAGFAITRSWPSVVAGNVAAVGAFVGHTLTLTVGLTVWAVDQCVRGVRLVRGSSFARSAQTIERTEHV